MRELATAALEAHANDRARYEELVARLRACGVAAEQVVQDMFLDEPWSLKLALLADIATLYSERFFLRAVTEYARYVQSAHTERAVVIALSRLRSAVLIENLEAFRKGLGLDNRWVYEQSIYFHLSHWGPEIQPLLKATLQDASQNPVDRMAAAAALGSIANSDTAQYLHAGFLSLPHQGTDADVRAYAVGLASLPKELLLQILARHFEGPGALHPHTNQLLYTSVLARNEAVGVAVLEEVLRSAKARGTHRQQALTAAVQLRDPAAARVILQNLPALSSEPSLHRNALAAVHALARNGRADAAALERSFADAHDPLTRSYLAMAVAHASDLSDRPELVSQLRQVLDEGSRDPSLRLPASLVGRANVVLASSSPDPVAALVHLATTLPDARDLDEARQEITLRLTSHVNDERAQPWVGRILAAPVLSEATVGERVHILHALRGVRALPRSIQDALFDFIGSNAEKPAAKLAVDYAMVVIAQHCPERFEEVRTRVVVTDPGARELLDAILKQNSRH